MTYPLKSIRLLILKYKSHGLDLTSANGDNGANLPVPAIYIINKKG
jgi:hypothetical protein